MASSPIENIPEPGAGGLPLFSASHRLFFAVGMIQVVLLMLLWSAELSMRLADFPDRLVIAASDVHAWLMVYGIFPFFIFGFLFTVYPRWMAQEPVGRAGYTRATLLLGAGLVIIYAGLWTSRLVLLA